MLNFTMLAKQENGEELYHIKDSTDVLINVVKKLNKQDLEKIQLDHYHKSIQVKLPELAFEIEGVGNNPPDFIISRNGKSYGLDLVALSFTERRKAFRDFSRLKAKVIKEYESGRLRSCHGIEIGVRFSSEVIPSDRYLEKAISDLIEWLDLLKPYPGFMEENNSDWVSQVGKCPYPLGETGVSRDGFIMWDVVTIGCISDNYFSRKCQFGIEHIYQETVTAVEIAERVNFLINNHDKSHQNIQELVIVAGGPDEFGEGRADEAAIANIFLKKSKDLVNPPNNIKRVVVDNWRTGDVVVIYETENFS